MAAEVSQSVRAYQWTRRPARSTPWREAKFSVIDFETTGLDPKSDEIVSFATVTVAEGRIRLADARYQVVRPRRMPGPETIRIHGLRESDLENAPPLSEVLDGLLEAITARALVAHVAAVETAFLRAALATQRIRFRNPIVDTAGLGAALQRERRLVPRMPRLRRRQAVGLSDLAKSLGLPVHRPHTADGDALTTAQVFIALATHLDQRKPQTVGSLARLRP